MDKFGFIIVLEEWGVLFPESILELSEHPAGDVDCARRTHVQDL